VLLGESDECQFYQDYGKKLVEEVHEHCGVEGKLDIITGTLGKSPWWRVWRSSSGRKGFIAFSYSNVSRPIFYFQIL